MIGDDDDDDDDYYLGMVDQSKPFGLIFNQDHHPRFLPLQMQDTTQAGYEPVQNLSSGFTE